MTTAKRKSPHKRTRRFPWIIVDEFHVESCADGKLLVVPRFADADHGPGLLTRLALAEWVEMELNSGRPKR